MAIKADGMFDWPSVSAMVDHLHSIREQQRREIEKMNFTRPQFMSHDAVRGFPKRMMEDGSMRYIDPYTGERLMIDPLSGMVVVDHTNEKRFDRSLLDDVVNNVVKIGREEELCLCSKALWS